MHGAFGAAGVTLTTVDPLSPTVTYSRPADPPRIAALTTFVGAKVTVANTSGNTINKVVLEGTVEVADPQEIISFFSVDGATCQVVPLSGNKVQITCSLGTFSAREAKQFTLFFIAPIQDPNVASQLPLGSDYVGFSGRVITAEGATKGKSPNDSVDFWPVPSATPTPFACPGPSLENPSSATHPCVRVDLGTPNDLQVKSAAPKTGGTFFTGDGGIPGLLGGDLFTTTVTVPSSQFITTATVVEAPLLTCTNFLTCYSSNIQIIDAATTTPADFSPAHATFVLRMGAENIKNGTHINSVTIMYSNGVNPPEIVGDCASPTTPLGNGKPCIAYRIAYKNSYKPNPALGGAFEWGIINTTNGVFQFF